MVVLTPLNKHLQKKQDNIFFVKTICVGVFFSFCVILAVIIIWLSTPDSPSHIRSDYVNQLKIEGRQNLRNILRDPDSLQIISEDVLWFDDEKKKGIYYAKYRAKNGFGGYGEEDVYFDGDILNSKNWREIGE